MSGEYIPWEQENWVKELDKLEKTAYVLQQRLDSHSQGFGTGIITAVHILKGALVLDSLHAFPEEEEISIELSKDKVKLLILVLTKFYQTSGSNKDVLDLIDRLTSVLEVN